MEEKFGNLAGISASLPNSSHDTNAATLKQLIGFANARARAGHKEGGSDWPRVARRIVAALPRTRRSLQKIGASTASVGLGHYPASRRGLVAAFGRAAAFAILTSVFVSQPAGTQSGMPNGSGCTDSNGCASGCCDPVSLTCVDSNHGQGKGAGCCAPTGRLQC